MCRIVQPKFFDDSRGPFIDRYLFGSHDSSINVTGCISLDFAETYSSVLGKDIHMTENTTTPKGTAFNLEQFVAYAEGAVVSKTLHKKDIGNITLFAFDRDQGLSEHTAPFDAVVYILDGDAKITLGGEPHTVTKGEMLIMPANVPHALHAVTRFKMLLVMIRGD